MKEKLSKISRICTKGWVLYFVPFVLLVIPYIQTIAKNKICVGGYYLIHYLYTYKHGFVSRGLVGEIISWFSPEVNDTVTRNTTLIFDFLMILFVSLCIGKALNKVKGNRELFVTTLVLIVFVCVWPTTIKYYLADIKLDKLLWALTFLAVFLASNRYTIWFVPLICIIATLVNPVFLFCGMILVSIIMLQKFTDSGFSAKNGVLCFIAYGSMIALGIFSIVSEKKLGFQTPKELVAYYFSRYTGGETINYEAFYRTWLFDYFTTPKEALKLAYKYYFGEWENWRACLSDLIFIFIPLFPVMGIFWIIAMKKENNKWQKFIFLLCLISPVVLIPPIAISWESSKYLSNNFIVQLCLIIYFIADKKPAVLKALERIRNYLNDRPIILSTFLTYIAMVFVAGMRGN